MNYSLSKFIIFQQSIIKNFHPKVFFHKTFTRFKEKLPSRRLEFD